MGAVPVPRGGSGVGPGQGTSCRCLSPVRAGQAADLTTNGRAGWGPSTACGGGAPHSAPPNGKATAESRPGNSHADHTTRP
jgi:hypothetical protein